MESARTPRALSVGAVTVVAGALCLTAVWGLSTPGPIRPAPPRRLFLPTPTPAPVVRLPLRRSTPAVSPPRARIAPAPPLPSAATPLASPRAGRDAFLNLPMRSSAALAEELRRNPRLRRLYARHFGVPEPRVVAFARDALVLVRLPAAQRVTVFGVTRDGRIYPVRQTLPKGALVWATRSGDPILKWACNNPVATELPGARLHPPRPTPRREPPLLRQHPPVVEIVPGVEPPRITPQTPVPGITPPIPVAGAPEVSGEAVAELRGTRGRGSLWRGGLPLLALVGSGGGSTHNPGTIPEPGTIALTALGGAVALLFWRRRQ